MSRFHLAAGESLVIELRGSEALRHSAPEIFQALLDSTAFVNARSAEAGGEPPLELVLV
jgi:hypothetical protein